MYWKKWTRKSEDRGASWGARVLLCAALFIAVAGGAIALDRLEDLQQRFDKESHAASKVKALDKLADAQFDTARKAAGANDFNTVGLTFEKYRDNVRASLELLKKQEPDVDKHVGPYRQLELELRKGIRELEDTMLVAPPEVQPPLQLVHKDILAMDNELIALLFPRRTQDPEKVPPVPEAKPKDADPKDPETKP
jgi:hypothetical protein